MGHVYVEALLGDPRRRRVRPVRLLVDTEATYLSLPPSLAEELGLRVEGEAELTLADGRMVIARTALAWLEVAGRGSVAQAAILDVDEPLLLRVCYPQVRHEILSARAWATFSILAFRNRNIFFSLQG